MNFKEAFEALNGVQPTAEDILKFERLVNILQTTPNDAFLSVLMAFEHYHKLYEQMPRKISSELNTSLEIVKCDADRLLRSAVESWKADLAKAHLTAAQATSKSIAETAATITKNHSKTKLNQTIMATVFVTILGLFTAGGGGFFLGREKGLNEVYKINAWLNTPDGQLAYRLFEKGEIEALAKCNKPGWEKTKDGLCLAKPTKQGLYGWRLK